MLVDASNAFNTINRKAFLHNVKVICNLIYVIATIPLILLTVQTLKEDSTDTKAVGYADDLFGGGKIKCLKRMWDMIEQWGPKYGYHQQEDKTWIIVKPEYLEEAT